MKREAKELTIIARQMITAAPKLDKIVRDFEEYQWRIKEFGANDSEANNFFNSLMKAAIRGEQFPRARPESWGLFSTMSGWKRKGVQLTLKAQTVFETILVSPYKDVIELAKYYGWDR